MFNQSAMDQNCIICGGNNEYYFSKTYANFPGGPFEDTLKVDYLRCSACGFVLSQTHAQMSEHDWSCLNMSWHHYLEHNFKAGITNQPPYADQALALKLLSENKIINISNSLDYAAGYGSMARVLEKYFGIGLSLYDKYITDGGTAGLSYIEERDLERYKLVINSAMFEHVLERSHLDAVNDLVAPDGTMMLHTVVCERVPADPNWFYLTPPVHTAFHTNRSMNILMEQWGYAASIYSPQAKSWFLYKENSPYLQHLENAVDEINQELQSKYFFFKKGFVDYWKGF